MEGSIGSATLERIAASDWDASHGLRGGVVAPTDAMRARSPEFIAALTPVRVAVSHEERERIYRFRYEVYVKELGRRYGNPDYALGTVSDEEDVQPYTTLLYTEEDGRVTGTMRLRCWAPGEVPGELWDESAMELFDGIEALTTSHVERVMVTPAQRGQRSFVSLVCAAYQLACGELGVDLAFCSVAPGLLNHFQLAGMRTYAAAVAPTPDGLDVPMVGVLSDRSYLERVGSFLAPFSDLFFGEGLRPALRGSVLAGALDGPAKAVEATAEIVHLELEQAAARHEGRAPSLLHSLHATTVGSLAERGFLVRVGPGEQIISRGVARQELFVIVDGTFESLSDDLQLSQLTGGGVIGVTACLSSTGRYTESVRAVSAGTLLCLTRASIRELRHQDPASAADLFLHLAKVLADRGC